MASPIDSLPFYFFQSPRDHAWFLEIGQHKIIGKIIFSMKFFDLKLVKIIADQAIFLTCVVCLSLE